MNVLPADIEYERLLGKQESQYVRPLTDFRAEVAAYFEAGPSTFGDPLPWGKTHELFRLRPGEVTIWAGIGGSGKSLITGQVILGLSRSRKCLIVSLEMPVRATIARMMRQAAGVEKPGLGFQTEFYEKTSRIWIYDQTDVVPPERILGMIHYAAAELGIEHVMIDCLVKVGLRTDNYNAAQAEFMNRICWAAKAHNVHIHVVHHLRKGQDISKTPTGWDLKGAGELRDLTDNLVLVWRNVVKEEKMSRGEHAPVTDPDVVLFVDKARHGEHTPKIGLFYHHPSQSFHGDPYNRVAILDHAR